jgi:hypothetical protein
MGHPSSDRRLIRKAAAELSDVDGVHLQVSVWGEGTCGHNTGAVFKLRSFGRYCRAFGPHAPRCDQSTIFWMQEHTRQL